MPTYTNRLIVLLTDGVPDCSFTAFSRLLSQSASPLGYRLVIGSPDLVSAFRDMKPAAYIVTTRQAATPEFRQLAQEGKEIYIIGQDDLADEGRGLADRILQSMKTKMIPSLVSSIVK
jgi:hypothetical protein